MNHVTNRESLRTASIEASEAKKVEGCCGGPATDASSACCALDEDAKAAGEPGCGCSKKQPTERKASCC